MFLIMLSTIIPKSAEEELAKLRADLFNSKVMQYMTTNMFYRDASYKKRLLLEREHLSVYFSTLKLSFKAEDILLSLEEEKEIDVEPNHMRTRIPTFAEIRGEI